MEKIVILYGSTDVTQHIDNSISRPGQDMRYALDDSKLRSLGWTAAAVFDNELVGIVKYYKNNFIW